MEVGSEKFLVITSMFIIHIDLRRGNFVLLIFSLCVRSASSEE